jgi:aminopeptidase N
MDTWTRQMGFPVIYLEQNESSWTVRQERFLDNRNLPQVKNSFDYRWEIPLNIQWENIDNVSKPIKLIWMPAHTNDTSNIY